MWSLPLDRMRNIIYILKETTFMIERLFRVARFRVIIVLYSIPNFVQPMVVQNVTEMKKALNVLFRKSSFTIWS